MRWKNWQFFIHSFCDSVQGVKERQEDISLHFVYMNLQKKFLEHSLLRVQGSINSLFHISDITASAQTCSRNPCQESRTTIRPTLEQSLFCTAGQTILMIEACRRRRAIFVFSDGFIKTQIMGGDIGSSASNTRTVQCVEPRLCAHSKIDCRRSSYRTRLRTSR